jgi:hypothetical protein
MRLRHLSERLHVPTLPDECQDPLVDWRHGLPLRTAERLSLRGAPPLRSSAVVDGPHTEAEHWLASFPGTLVVCTVAVERAERWRMPLATRKWKKEAGRCRAPSLSVWP